MRIVEEINHPIHVEKKLMEAWYFYKKSPDSVFIFLYLYWKVCIYNCLYLSPPASVVIDTSISFSC